MPVPPAPAVPTVAIVADSAFGVASIVIAMPVEKPETLAVLMFVAPAAAAAASVVGPARKATAVLFSSTTLASAVAPKSQPARVYGTHGAGVFFGEPESPLTMLKFVSAGGVGGSVAAFPPSVMSVQYLNDDEKPTLPFGRKNPYEFVTPWPLGQAGPRRRVKLVEKTCGFGGFFIRTASR